MEGREDGRDGAAVFATYMDLSYNGIGAKL